MMSIFALVLTLLSSSNEVLAGSDNKVRPRLLVFAAASMKNALEAIGRQFEPECGCQIVFSFAGSGTLARQIVAGAPADLYISADVNWMNWLQEAGAVAAGSKTIIATNRLVIAIGKDATLPKSPISAAQLLEIRPIAMANPDYVPAGRYGRQALENLGLWKEISNRIVYGENVRVSLSLVARGDVAAAIIYRSDAKIEPRVKVAYTFDSDDHQPINYPASRIERAGRNPQIGENFLRFLTSPGPSQIFGEFGFSAQIKVDAHD